MSKLKIQSTVHPPEQVSFNEWHVAIRKELADGTASVEREVLYTLYVAIKEHRAAMQLMSLRAMDKMLNLAEIGLNVNQ
jgi:hypothetical protein